MGLASGWEPRGQGIGDEHDNLDRSEGATRFARTVESPSSLLESIAGGLLERMSDVYFNCPHCEQRFKVLEEYLGQVIECPLCNGSIQLPAPKPQAGQLNLPASKDTKRAARFGARGFLYGFLAGYVLMHFGNGPQFVIMNLMGALFMALCLGVFGQLLGACQRQ